jgi:hypothetical protein
MLLHITPKLYQPAERFHTACLVDIVIPQLGLHLREGKDLVAKTPYPDKHYLVAGRKYGRKSVTGIFIEAPDKIRTFTATTRWAVSAEYLLTHSVEYDILGADCDAASDNMMLWGNLHHSHGGWPCRWPDVAKDWVPNTHAPQMDTYKSNRGGDVRDKHNEHGLIVERFERFVIPALERERVIMRNNLTDRMPTLESAFVSPLCDLDITDQSKPSLMQLAG